MVRNDRLKPKPVPNGSRSKQHLGQSEQNQRLEQFKRYLENRGCPVRLAPKDENEVRWIG